MSGVRANSRRLHVFCVSTGYSAVSGAPSVDRCKRARYHKFPTKGAYIPHSTVNKTHGPCLQKAARLSSAHQNPQPQYVPVPDLHHVRSSRPALTLSPTQPPVLSRAELQHTQLVMHHPLPSLSRAPSEVCTPSYPPREVRVSIQHHSESSAARAASHGTHRPRAKACPAEAEGTQLGSGHLTLGSSPPGPREFKFNSRDKR